MTEAKGPGNLRLQLTNFVGRRKDIANVRDAMAESRLVTLIGPGGVGKTRLALHVGMMVRASFEDGVWLVDLAPLTDPALVPEALMSALEIRTTSTQSVADQLSAHLSQRHLLVILDNCEHVLPGCRLLVEKLLENSPRLSILATSRERLGVKGERILPVLPFELPQANEVLDETAVRRIDSLAFLHDRARASSPDFRITNENIAAAAELCIQLDGIPLALELAASRLRSLSVRQLLERLKSRFAILTSGSPTAPPRQQTLRALIDWSYERCSSEEKVLWRRMSVFAGSADLDAIERTCSDEILSQSSILEVVDSLVSKSILIAIVTPKSVRYQVLETIRQYGLERAQDAGEEAALRRRHLQYYLELSQSSAEEFWSQEQNIWISRLRVEHENIRAALTYCTARMESSDVLALQLVTALRFHWMVGGFVSEGRRWLDLVLAASTEHDIEKCRALCVAAWMASVQGDLAGSHQRLTECTLLLEELRAAGKISEPDFDDIETQIQIWSGSLLLFGGNPSAAAATFEKALARSRAANRIEGTMLVLFQLSTTYALMGDFPKAEEVSGESIAISDTVGETYAKSLTLWSKAYCAWAQGNPEGALEYAHQSLARALVFDDKVVTALNLEVVSSALAEQTKYEDAAVIQGVASRVWEAVESSIDSFGPDLAGAHDRWAKRAHKALGPRTYREALARGYRMSPEEVRARVLGFKVSEQDSASDREAGALTKRQRQVATLIADGQSNREIADNLVLSTRTVEGHVESILSKLGMTSRTQIASWMNRRSVPDR
ncbi:bacterial regulatory s, luxR family protein [Pseudarthrobacter siccitolerans]|uniref:Bacterial regulatory s, luxR family protein n=1 Tax=Pseudarthrobacter siccitolerans TaxID=861266 RepID=A0A024H324_9MICC|nr:LuxR C-terminal-related transcriptional regulator [Pseudarthrobacter siccitolerans]CCQ46126.1 bacterial regulatory s, luxR family protein [Pseudarthrobacter siccitolerans]